VSEVAAKRQEAIAEHRDAMLSNTIVLLRRFNRELPGDPNVELQAIGAVFLSPHHAQAAALLKKAQPGVFFCRDHAWLWQQLQAGFLKGVSNFSSDRDIGWWLNRYRIVGEFRRLFGYSVYPVIAAALTSSFWWHGPFYVERVIDIAKRRTRLVKAAAELQEALGCGT